MKSEKATTFLIWMIPLFSDHYPTTVLLHCCKHSYFPAGVTLDFELDQYEVSENQGMVTVCVVLRGSLELEIVAEISAAPGGSATPITDFQFPPITLVFGPTTVPRTCLSIAVSTDAIIEAEENILLSLSTIFSEVNVGESEVLVQDTTTGTVQYLNSTDITITEGDPAILLCFQNMLELDRDIAIEINFDFAEGRLIMIIPSQLLQELIKEYVITCDNPLPQTLLYYYKLSAL